MPVKQYRLLRDFGNQAFGEHGVRHGLKSGSIGRYSESVAAAEQGAHNTEEDAIVLEFDDEARSVGNDGELKVGAVKRRIAFGTAEFARLFEEVA